MRRGSSEYASRAMESSQSTRRETFLGFQPPAIGDEEIEAVAETLRSGWLTTGPRTAELERRFAEYVGAEHAVAVASGTDALLVSLAGARGRARRRGDHDADHVACDGERDRSHRRSACLCGRSGRRPEHRPGAGCIARRSEDEGRCFRSISAGQPVDLEPLWALGVPVVEDAAHAVESVYRCRKIGGLSDATCFSLYATKNVAAGEGGDHQHEPRRRRSGGGRPARHAAGPWLALRHSRSRL